MKTYKHKFNGSTMTFKDGCMKIENLVIEGTPNLEYWEEVVEKEYEILSIHRADVGVLNLDKQGHYQFISNNGGGFALSLDVALKREFNFKIHSVKNAQGEILKIGDFVEENVTEACHGWYITEFSLKDSRCFSAGVNVNNISKVKECLLITEDGVDIFEGDKVWGITKDIWKPFYQNAKSNPLNKAVTETWLHGKFSTKEAAEEYILFNKPCLSLNDVFKVYPQIKRKERFVNTVHANELIDVAKKKL